MTDKPEQWVEHKRKYSRENMRNKSVRFTMFFEEGSPVASVTIVSVNVKTGSLGISNTVYYKERYIAPTTHKRLTGKHLAGEYKKALSYMNKKRRLKQ